MAEYFRDLPPMNEEFEALRFKSSILGFSVFIGLIGVPMLSIPLLPLYTAIGIPTSAIPILIAGEAIGGFLALWIGYAVYDAIYPLRVGPAGICTYNGLGIVTRVRWKDIREVKTIPFGPGLRYAYLKHGKNILTGAYVPLYLRSYEEFRDAVIANAGADHPLAQIL